jgi:hypothetical protein
MLWIHIGINMDPDPASYIYVVPDPVPGSQTNAEPDLGQTLMSQKVYFYMKI